MNFGLIVKALAVIVILTGIVVMIGWIANIPFLKSILPGWVTMKFITALSFLASGIIVFLLSQKEKNDVSNLLILIVSFALFLLMVTFLISIFTNISFGIENLFIKEEANAVRTTVPGVPALPTIICFILIALAGLIFSYKNKNSWFQFFLGLIVFIAGFSAVIGYLTKVPILYYSFKGYTAMAFHTAILFVLIGISLMFIKKIDNIK